MPKRALSPTRDFSTSPSSSSSRPKQPCLPFYLRDGLLESMLYTVCSFLSVYEVGCILRRTCRALHGRVAADCLLHHHLTLNPRSLPALVASQPSTRALIRRIPSLSLLYHNVHDHKEQHMAMPPLHSLRCPVHACRFLFSSLSSLYVCVGAALSATAC